MVHKDQSHNPVGADENNDELAAHEAERKALEKARDPVDTLSQSGDEDANPANLHYGSRTDEGLTAESEVNDGAPKAPPPVGELISGEWATRGEETQQLNRSNENRGNANPNDPQRLNEHGDQEGRSANSETPPAAQQVEGGDIAPAGAEENGSGPVQAAALSVKRGGVNEAPFDIELSDTIIDENVSGAKIAELTSSDNDEDAIAAYSIAEDDSGLFEIVGNELRLKEGVSFDFESQSEYSITLTVTDSDGATYDETFSIVVGDVNEAPEALTLSNATVDENEAGAIVGDLSLTDVDAGDSHTFAVSDDRFEVVGGQLKLKDGVALDHETAASLDVTVTATDSGGLSTSEIFSISVGDVNEAPEALTLSNASVDENNAGAIVGDLTLSDVDAGDSHSFAVSDDRFEVVGGQLKLKDGVALDHETAASLDVTVTATDSGGLSANETFTLDVGDVNEAPEALTLSNASVDENEAGAIVGDLSLTDVDAGESHAFAVSDDRFEVVGGQLKLKDGVALDHETADSIDVVVTATDSGGLSTNETFSIAIGDVNEAPEALALSNTTIDENDVGAVVGNLSLTDVDAGDSHTFAVSDDRFEVVGGQLKLKDGVALDHETADSIDVTVTATDSGGLSTNETFSIAVGDVNETPEGLALSNATVDENAAGAVVGDLSLTDVDAGDSHTFAVSDDRFEVVGGQLKLKDGVALDHEVAASIDVTVTATDGGGLSTNETFTLDVGDVNEAPEGLALSNATVDENDVGAVVGNLSLMDVDDGDSHTYAVDDARFEVVGGQLKLKDGVALDHEKADSIDVTVTATDAGGLSTNETFTLTIGDENEAPENLTLSNATVDENDAGAVVGNLSLSDVDAGDSHTFAVSDDRFEVVGGQLKLKDGVALDHEVAASIDVTVTATDGGGLSTNETFTLDVSDANEAPEGLALSNATVDENNADAVVGNLSLTDVDVGDSHTYAVDDTRFEVVGGQLKLRDGVALDHETADSIDVVVTATDSGGLSTNETFSIAIGDVNEAPEALALSNTTIDENDVGAVVGNLSLSDVDDGDSHTYAVDDARFEVVGGQLKLKDGVGLKNEDAASVDVIVTATDNGGLTTEETFTIDVTDHDQVISGSIDPTVGDIGQVGTVTVGQASSAQWHSVAFDQPIADAVVVMGTMSQNGTDPFTIRVRNVTDNGFEFQIDEWDYLDGYHTTETLSWMAVEEGVHTLENGQTLYAGNENVDSKKAKVDLPDELTDPVVLAQVQSVNEASAVTVRTDIQKNGKVELYLQEEESIRNKGHVDETVGVIAIDNGGAAADGIIVGTTGDRVRHVNVNESYGDDFNGVEHALFTNMQSDDGGDTAVAQVTASTDTGFTVHIDEEQSKNSEVNHTTEDVGFAAIETGILKAVTAPGAADLDDTLTGGLGDDTISGGGGEDVIDGRAGDDVLIGGLGDDMISGGDGADAFIYQMGDGNDVITGGAGGGWTDVLQLDAGNGGFGDLGVDWTITLTEGAITSQDSDSIDLSDDATGIVTFADGSTVNFEGIDEIGFA